MFLWSQLQLLTGLGEYSGGLLIHVGVYRDRGGVAICMHTELLLVIRVRGRLQVWERRGRCRGVDIGIPTKELRACVCACVRVCVCTMKRCSTSNLTNVFTHNYTSPVSFPGPCLALHCLRRPGNETSSSAVMKEHTATSNLPTAYLHF